MSIRHKLQLVIRESGMSEAKIAREASLAQKTVNAITTGQNKEPKLSTAAAISRVLSVSLDWLANDSLPDDMVPDWARTPADWGYITAPIPASKDDHVEVHIAGIADYGEHLKRLIRQNERAKRAAKKPAAGPPRTGRNDTPASPPIRPKKR